MPRSMPKESLVPITGHLRIKWWAFAPFALLTFIHLYALAVGSSELASGTKSFFDGRAALGLPTGHTTGCVDR